MLVIYPNNPDVALPAGSTRDPDYVQSLGGRYIRPTPLISISQNPIRNKMGQLGSTYDITLNGTIVTRRRSAIVQQGSNAVSIFDDEDQPLSFNDTNEPFELSEKLPEIIFRQNQLREWFHNDWVRLEVLDVNSNHMLFGFTARVQSVNFEEGIWVDTCRYSINLQADYLFDDQYRILTDGLPDRSGLFNSTGRKTYQEIIEEVSGLVEDFNDTWSVEADESTGQFINGSFMPRTYRVTRNMTATGRRVTVPLVPGTTGIIKEPWEHARDFLLKNVDFDSIGNKYQPTYEGSKYFGTAFSTILSSGTMGVPSGYQGYNHVRSENIDKAAGSYSISDSWILCSGDAALENYNLSVSTSTDSPYVSVSIDGNIKGLDQRHATTYNGDNSSPLLPNAYDRALAKYYEISNSGSFGINSHVYRRANNTVAQNLNSQPKTVSLGLNELNGEITYNLEFDNRPTNFFSGVLSESINVNDTYPGDLFAVIPVIGRLTGPVLQYIGGRTEYKRDITIEIVLDGTDLGYNNDRNSFILSKPSINEPHRTQLNELIHMLSPATEPYIRKYFLNPPSESWSPKEGRYSLSMSWVYELDR